MIEEEGRLREERRAKMKEIKENMSNGLWREGMYKDLSSTNYLTTPESEIYIKSAPNNSNETPTFTCLGRAGCFGQH